MKKQTVTTIEIKSKFRRTSVTGLHFLHLVTTEFMHNTYAGSIRTTAGSAKWKTKEVSK